MSNNNHTPIIILANPQMAENIGMVARAMLNCGLTQLRLVAPRDGWPNQVAYPPAAGADMVLDNAQTFETLAEAVADCHLVLATTGLERDVRKPLLTPEKAVQAACAVPQGQQVAIVFGCERAGLDNNQITMADALITIPLNPEFSSLNLAQAVLIMGYLWRQQTHAHTQAGFDIFPVAETEQATKGEIEHMLQFLEKGLDTKGFYTNPDMRPRMLQNLRHAFQRMRLTRQECTTFYGIFKCLLK
jgi:tRNA/rRNA methyltransferase